MAWENVSNGTCKNLRLRSTCTFLLHSKDCSSCLVWASARQGLHYDLCDKRRLRSDCADAQSDLSLRLSHKSSLIACASNSLWAIQRGITLPYRGNVQANLSLCWSHKSYCRFCRALAHLKNNHKHIFGHTNRFKWSKQTHFRSYQWVHM